MIYTRLRMRTRRGDTDVGRLIGTLVSVALLGLLCYGIWWVIKNLGQAGQQYTDVMVETKHRAEDIRCQANLRTIWQNIQMHAAAEGGFPRSTEALMRYSGGSDLFTCPIPDGGQYVYIPGQSPDMPAENVLVYEPNAVHDGCGNVLLLGGRIVQLTPEQLRIAISQTLKRLE